MFSNCCIARFADFIFCLVARNTTKQGASQLQPRVLQAEFELRTLHETSTFPWGKLNIVSDVFNPSQKLNASGKNPTQKHLYSSWEMHGWQHLRRYFNMYCKMINHNHLYSSRETSDSEHLHKNDQSKPSVFQLGNWWFWAPVRKWPTRIIDIPARKLMVLGTCQINIAQNHLYSS